MKLTAAISILATLLAGCGKPPVQAQRFAYLDTLGIKYKGYNNDSILKYASSGSTGWNKYGKIQDKQMGGVYSIHNSRPVPQSGLHTDTTFYEERNGMRTVVYTVFYDAKILMSTMFIVDKKYIYNAYVDSNFLRYIATKDHHTTK